MGPRELVKPPRSRVFHYDGVRVRVTGRPVHVRWLEECLAPCFDVEEVSRADCEVELTVDAEALDDPVGEAGSNGAERVDCFALDSHVVSLPIVESSGDPLVVRDETFDVLYRIRRDPPRVELVARPGRILRTPLMRVVREFAMNHSQATGGLFLHACAFARDGDAVLAAGPKASGKTSLLTHALHAPGVRYLANDRVLLRGEGDATKARGMPAFVTLRPAMLERFPALRERLLETGYDHRATLVEGERGDPARTSPWPDGRFGLSVAQFCELIGVGAVAEARVRALLFPRVSEQAKGIELHALAPREAAQRLSGALFGVGSLRKSSDVFRLADDAAPEPATLEASFLELAGRIPCFEARMGADAYRRGASGAADFVESALVRARSPSTSSPGA